ncbi:MAG TPA: acyl carrier protein [Bacillota bacterium]|nr:acyl carrier protein [Bacillota bacterium]
MQDILNRVRQATVAVLKINAEEITLESRFRADLGADSINLVEIAMALESEFDIILEDDEVTNIVTVQDAVTFISGHQK